MDRVIVYPQEELYDWFFTKQAQNTMLGLGKLAQALAGTSTFVVGLPCTPNSPAALNVLVGEGEIYMTANVEASTMGTLPQDTSHQVLKQGMLRNTQTLSCPAPASAGQSINYLIQATYQDVDVSVDPTTGATPVVAQFFSGTVGGTPYSGPNNTGASSNTARTGACVISAKAGVAATTGSQTTPAPDSGYVGLYVVTVANGQTSITSGNIVQYAAAPFLPYTLAQLSPGFSHLQIYSTPGTYTFTVPAGVTKLDVEGWGGGGGGAGNPSNAVGAGGGGGAYGRKLCTVTPGQAITVTVAAVAAGGAAGANNGANGGSCSFGSFLTVAGGNGGATSTGAGAAGGAAPTADIAMAGQGAPGSFATGGTAYGVGGNAPRGGQSGNLSTPTGTNGGWPGGGAGPGYNPSASAAGGAGAAGGFLVWW